MLRFSTWPGSRSLKVEESEPPSELSPCAISQIELTGKHIRSALQTPRTTLEPLEESLPKFCANRPKLLQSLL